MSRKLTLLFGGPRGIGAPRAVAEAMSFLAPDRASWVRGQAVQPNGGPT
jgi:NAD(P)-dependent dehydrogenase (short-subunit alcohol dehydrogenase family)